MRTLTLFICLLLYSVVAKTQNTIVTDFPNMSDSTKLVPDASDCYRFIGDSAVAYSDIFIDKVTKKDEVYYKATLHCSFKHWKKYYGYTKVWWINFDTREWESRWQNGRYWKYTYTYEKYQVVFKNLSEKENSIKLLKESMNN